MFSVEMGEDIHSFPILAYGFLLEFDKMPLESKYLCGRKEWMVNFQIV